MRKMSIFKRLLLLCLILVIWKITTSCETVRIVDGCYGYWEDNGLKRGTIAKNWVYLHPYRQCVEETPPHRNTRKQWQK